MKVLLAVIVLFFSNLVSASAPGQFIGYTKINSISSRTNGHQALFIDAVIPRMGCYHHDRIIIDENKIGSKTMISLALLAISSDRQVSFKLEGCGLIDPGTSTEDAPIVKRLKIK